METKQLSIKTARQLLEFLPQETKMTMKIPALIQLVTYLEIQYKDFKVVNKRILNIDKHNALLSLKDHINALDRNVSIPPSLMVLLIFFTLRKKKNLSFEKKEFTLRKTMCGGGCDSNKDMPRIQDTA